MMCMKASGGYSSTSFVAFFSDVHCYRCSTETTDKKLIEHLKRLGLRFQGFKKIEQVYINAFVQKKLS